MLTPHFGKSADMGGGPADVVECLVSMVYIIEYRIVVEVLFIKISWQSYFLRRDISDIFYLESSPSIKLNTIMLLVDVGSSHFFIEFYTRNSK
jgi:hypothetical protein